MSRKSVQISLDEALLKRIDADPETRKQGRSCFVRSAIEAYLKAKDRRIEAQLHEAYGDEGDAMAWEISGLIEAQA